MQGDRCLYPPSYSYLGNQNAVGNLESHQPQRFESVIELQAYATRRRHEIFSFLIDHVHVDDEASATNR